MTWINQSAIDLRGDSASAVRSTYATHSPAVLATIIVNDRLNRFIADNDGADESAIPYMGWYWRSVDFFNPRGITIARGGEGVAVCQNNKWGYGERDLTEDEQAEFRALIWAAWVESRRGGILSEINQKTRDALESAGRYIASLGGPFDD